MRRFLTGLTAILTAVLLVAGCSSSDDTADEPTTATSATTVAPPETVTTASNVSEPLTIMAIGDSFTDQTQAGTYRCYLDQMLNEAGVSFDFVGSNEPPASLYACPTEFDTGHEARLGGSIDDLSGPAVESVALLRPDVALVLLGASDIRLDRQPVDEAADELASFVEDLQATRSDITILVAQLMPCASTETVCQEGWPAFNDAIASFGRLSTDRSAVAVVDMYTGFSLNDLLPDGFHPNDAGDQEMARRWMSALEEAGAVNTDG